MMQTKGAVPPRWAERLLQAWLPDDSMRDAILGDLREELVRDSADVGVSEARSLYRQRVAGIVGYVMLDMLRWRPWGNDAPEMARVRRTVAVRGGQARARLRRGDFWIVAMAFSVLGGGIVLNTLLFSATRHGAATTASATASPALGIASLVLTLGSAAVAAVVLCVGPRWLRRRLCHKAMEAQHAPR